jgi:hypothetical protein
MNADNEIDHYGLGWAFFKSGGVKGGHFLPFETDNLIEWVRGFCAAQFHANNVKQYPSVELALIDNDVEGVLLEKLLQAAEFIASGNKLPVPVRGRAKLRIVSREMG